MIPGAALRPVRVVIVDDSGATRATLATILQGEPGVEVVLSTADGDEALRHALRDRPDVVCLDLEMPGMDGFTFLRLLMSRCPTPVVVVSSSSHEAQVFKALELGALDFVAKPERGSDVAAIGRELLDKIATVRALRSGDFARTAAAAGAAHRARGAAPPRAARGGARGAAGMRLAVIGASTGGPPALTRLLAMLPADLPLAIAVAQHMPQKFTATFAERLDRRTSFDVSEAADGDELCPGRVVIAPGGRHMEIVRGGPPPRGPLRARIVEPPAGERRHRPSVDRLFESAARAWGREVCAVVLTGMGSDGREGVRAVKAAGGLTLAESERTAVVYGMPKEAIESGSVDEALPLEAMAERIAEFASGR